MSFRYARSSPSQKLTAMPLEPARPGDQRYSCADTAKLNRLLGWKPLIGLDEGLARQVAWQRGQGSGLVT